MATVSFTKNIVVKESEAVNRFISAVTDRKSNPPVNEDLASDKTMERGRVLLKQYLSR